MTIRFIEIPKAYKQYISCEGCGQQTLNTGGKKCLCSSCGHYNKQWLRHRYDQQRRSLAKHSRKQSGTHAAIASDLDGVPVRTVVLP